MKSNQNQKQMKPTIILAHDKKNSSFKVKTSSLQLARLNDDSQPDAPLTPEFLDFLKADDKTKVKKILKEIETFEQKLKLLLRFEKTRRNANNENFSPREQQVQHKIINEVKSLKKAVCEWIQNNNRPLEFPQVETIEKVFVSIAKEDKSAIQSSTIDGEFPQKKSSDNERKKQ